MPRKLSVDLISRIDDRLSALGDEAKSGAMSAIARDAGVSTTYVVTRAKARGIKVGRGRPKKVSAA